MPSDALASIAERIAQQITPEHRVDLAEFMRRTMALEPARHHRVWLQYLQDQSYKRLCFICPPGHAKTTVVGVAYPAWAIANNPSLHVLYIGNTVTQARKQSIAVRDLLTSPTSREIYPAIQRSNKGWATDRWYVERPNIWDKDPTFMALGIDGPALGARADLIILDDVADNRNTATAQQRVKLRNKVLAVAMSRQSSPDTRIVAVMTRWHEDDLAALLEEQGFNIVWMPALGYWDVVVNPQAATEECTDHAHPPMSLAQINDLVATHDLNNGTPLWPEQYPADFFMQFRLDQTTWMMEYQGATVRASNDTQDRFDTNAIKLWEHIDPDSVRNCWWFWDTANTASANSDYWCGQLWAWCFDGLYLIKVINVKADFPTGLKMVRECAQQPVEIGGRIFSVGASYIESTGTNNGAALLQLLSAERLRIYEWRPALSKQQRGAKAAVWLRDNAIYFPVNQECYQGATDNGALNLKTMLKQFALWPWGRHDDIVDCTSMALEQLSTLPIYAFDARVNRLTANDVLRTPRGRVKTALPMVFGSGDGKGKRIRKGMFAARF